MLSNLIAKIKDKPTEYIIAGATTLASLLFAIIWREWLSEALTRTTAAVPTRVVWAILGEALIVVSGLVTYSLYVRSQLKKSDAKSATLQDLIDNPPKVFKFSVWWDKQGIPYCPTDKITPLGEEFSAEHMRLTFYCHTHKHHIAPRDDGGKLLPPQEAKRLLSSNEPELPTETLEATRPHKVKRLPDPIKVSHAISTLEVIKGNLPPRGDIEEKYVIIYNNAIGDISDNVDGKVSDFFIPQSELEHHLVSQRIRPRVSRFDKGPDKTYSKERYCDREIVLMTIDRAINHLKQLLQAR